MKYYIVDDDIGAVKTLANILKARGIGDVLGYSTDPEEAIGEIRSDKPDIVLVDLLMSGMDGITLVSKVRETSPDISFVMISKVTDKDMIGNAYNAGVQFFINKPINVIEVEKVLSTVADHRKMKSIMNNIHDMFGSGQSQPVQQPQPKDNLKEINILLGMLGMIGEKGTADIQNICEYMITNDKGYDRESLESAAAKAGDSPKNIEQRVRRAIKKGLTNVANAGLDDYAGEVFAVYANYVFDFKNIKDEMDYVKGKAAYGGRVNIAKFVEGLILYKNYSL